MTRGYVRILICHVEEQTIVRFRERLCNVNKLCIHQKIAWIETKMQRLERWIDKNKNVLNPTKYMLYYQAPVALLISYHVSGRILGSFGSFKEALILATAIFSHLFTSNIHAILYLNFIYCFFSV